MVNDIVKDFTPELIIGEKNDFNYFQSIYIITFEYFYRVVVGTGCQSVAVGMPDNGLDILRVRGEHGGTFKVLV